MLRILLIGLLLVLQAAAQVIPGHYLVELETSPMLERSATPAARNTRRAAIASEQQRLRGAISQRGAEVLDSMDTVANLLSVRMPAGNSEQLRGIPGVKAVHKVYRRYKSLDQAQVLHHVPEAWQLAGGAETAGAGVKIGIIDTGIDPNHPGLRDPSLTAPAGFPQARRPADLAITTGKVIVARSYDDLYGLPGETSALDRDGHGTAVAMSAAGVQTQASYARVSGVAPRAFLGAYRVFNAQEEGASDAVILRAIDDAITDGMDVINLSLGSQLSDNTIDGLYSTVFQRAAAAGIIVVVAAGNTGSGITTVASPSYLPEAISVAATWNRRQFEFPVMIGGNTFLGQPGSVPNVLSAISGQIFDTRSLGCLPQNFSGSAGKIALMDRGGCLFEVKINNAQAAGAIAALIVDDGSGLGMNVLGATLPAMLIQRADGAAIRGLLATNSAEEVQVGFNGREAPLDSHQVADFSGRGPSITRRAKPDIGAVGVALYTATPTTEDRSGFQLQNGTSFSSPLVAGAAGILKSARPGLTTAQYRSLLVNTASAFGPESGGEFTPLDVGAGLLNLDAALRSSIAASDLAVSFSAAAGSVNETRALTLYNLGSAADSLRLEIVPQSGLSPSLPADTIDIPAGGSREISLSIEGSGLTPGTTQGILRVQSLQTGSVLRIPYWFAVASGLPQRLDSFGTDPALPRAGADTEYLFRLIDTSGLSIDSAEHISATAQSQGLVITGTVSLYTESPGLFAVRLRPAPGVNRILIQAGSFQQMVSFRAGQ